MAATATAASVITYKDEGVLDLNENELERQRLIDDLFADSGSKPNRKGFPASKRVESSNSEDDSASLVLLVAETNRYYDQTVDALCGLDNLPLGSHLRNWTTDN